MLKEYLKKKKLTLYSLAQDSGLSYTTVYNLASGKVNIETCSYGVVKKIAACLDLTLEELELLVERVNTDQFASHQRHLVKRMGELEYIIDVLENRIIDRYWKLSMAFEAMYILALVDHLSKKNGIPICSQYDEIRSYTLEDPVFPIDVRLEEKMGNKEAQKKAVNASAPEFLRFNIIESLGER